MTRRIRKARRGVRERAERGRGEGIVLIPRGTSTMSDEEFWGRVRETAPTAEDVIQVTGWRSGQ